MEHRERWLLIWSAGSGVVGASADRLDAETRAFDHVLTCLSPLAARQPGAVVLASSAGGVYAGTAERPLTEASAVAPLSEYGRNKLRQEAMLSAWARAHPSVSTLVGRISNLYGPRQNLDKPQGFISQLSRCLVFQRPVHIYVPLDTMRDFLYVDDAAVQLVTSLERLLSLPAGEHVTRIIASEQSTSLARIIGLFALLVRHHPRVICAPSSGLRQQQPPALQFQSRVWRDLDAPRTGLLVGIDRVHRHHLALHGRGLLAPPRLARLG